jgi:hypothetical protein
MCSPVNFTDEERTCFHLQGRIVSLASNRTLVGVFFPGHIRYTYNCWPVVRRLLSTVAYFTAWVWSGNRDLFAVMDNKTTQLGQAVETTRSRNTLGMNRRPCEGIYVSQHSTGRAVCTVRRILWKLKTLRYIKNINEVFTFCVKLEIMWIPKNSAKYCSMYSRCSAIG